MQGMALDFATISDALGVSKGETNFGRQDGNNLSEPQAIFADWHNDWSAFAYGASGISTQSLSIATTNPQVFKAGMSEIGVNLAKPLSGQKESIGLISALDIDVQWQDNPVPTTLQDDIYEALVLKNGVTMYRVQLCNAAWLEDPLVRVNLRDGNALWLMTTGRPATEAGLALRATTLCHASRIEARDFGSHLILPAINLRHSPNTSWFKGMTIGEVRRDRTIEQAHQHINLRLSQNGGNGNASGETPRGTSEQAFIIDRAFMGFFTIGQMWRDTFCAPVCAFYAPPTCWLKLID